VPSTAIAVAGVGLDQAGVDGKAFPADQALVDAAPQHALEQPPQQIALAKAAMPVLRERRVIGNLAIQTESAEPSVRQIEMNLLAEPPLGPDAHAVADDQHSDHQLRVNRGPSNPTVKGLQSLTETFEVEMPVNAAQ